MWPILVPRTSINTELIQTIRRISSDADNLRGRRNDALTTAYAQWASTAFNQLRHALNPDDVDSLVRTRTFWALLHGNPWDQQVSNLIDSAITEFTESSAAIVSSFEDFVRWWDDVATIAVLDTSVLMDRAWQLDSTDWFEVLEQPRDQFLRLVVPLVAVDELDRLKDSGQDSNRNRARVAIRYLESTVEGEGRFKVPSAVGGAESTLEILIDPPRTYGSRLTTRSSDRPRCSNVSLPTGQSSRPGTLGCCYALDTSGSTACESDLLPTPIQHQGPRAGASGPAR